MSRELALDHWLTQVLETPDFKRVPLAGDASFRRYFRVFIEKTQYVVMDAPPPESTDLFVKVGRMLAKQGVTVPTVLHSSSQGFLVLSDFGDQLYLNKLNHHTADLLYQDAFQALLKMQTCENDVPCFEETFVANQLGLFEEWYIQKHKSKQITPVIRALLNAVYALLWQNIQVQPQVFVHRDYHSRNLMLISAGNPGILDFQDAMRGPITYDLVSLLQDCYIAWPRKQVEQWVSVFHQQAISSCLLPKEVPLETFLKWFDWTGLQRHLKNLGIFARLHYRDGKSGYLKDIPLVTRYIFESCARYPELENFSLFFQELVAEESSLCGQ